MYRRLLTVFLLGACSLFAEVKPAGIFTDNAVLQQGEPVRIWGTADPQEKVTVQFAGQKKIAEADDSGKWMITLDPMPVSAEPHDMVFTSSLDTRHLTLTNILVGEVWLAGGQSNMQTTMDFYKETVRADIDSANDPLLRMVTIPDNFYEGYSRARPKWEATTPQTVSGFSAAAYYFAKNLREVLGVPVGIIACSVGGTPAESWMSRKTLESREDLKRVLDAYEHHYETTYKNEAEYLQDIEKFMKDIHEWKRKTAAGEEAGPRPAWPVGPRYMRRPCGLYENMLMQTIPYTIKGVIWYQGECNAGAGFHYRSVQSALIEEWREEFRNKNLPFLFAQLAAYGPATSTAPQWPELRDSQSWTEDHVKNTGMIVLVDAGDQKNIHPPAKARVGHRFSLLARNMVYGETNLVCRGPRLKEAEVKDGTIELTFKDIGSGLVLRPEKISAFEICGEDGKFIPAKAELVDGKVVVSSEKIPAPKYVRYGWRMWFAPTLFNKEGLPASPFRTDDFPPVTKDHYYLDNI